MTKQQGETLLARCKVLIEQTVDEYGDVIDSCSVCWDTILDIKEIVDEIERGGKQNV